MSKLSVRPARLPDDEPAILAFIEALQSYEAAFEANRRQDETFAREHWSVLKERAAARNGVVLIAERDDVPVGWACAYDDDGEVFMALPERRHGFLAEMFVAPEARGEGHGRALIGAVEAWARERGHKVMMIGVLAGNARAIRAYEGAGYAPYGLTVRKYL